MDKPGPGDWVKELFAPIYDFDAIVNAGKDGYTENKTKIQRVPILDPLSVKDVFERVHERVLESERLKQQEIEHAKEKAKETLLDPRKSAVWNTEDLETLRKVYKAAKREISRLESSVREKEKFTESLSKQSEIQEKELRELKQKLKETTSSNVRLAIHRDALQKENKILDLKALALADAWKEMALEKNKAVEAQKAAEMRLDNERLAREKLEADIQEVRSSLVREITLVERNLTTKFEIEINDLNEVIRDLSVDLQEERKLHEASKRGLDHLRTHFSSLPLSHIANPGEKIDKINHIGS